ncbi:MAG TPA: hypothetical protein VFV79_10345, partial [Saprospiraceae bacterium]|nr:hypothetical protein [Saprospiraceae bacterium]
MKNKIPQIKKWLWAMVLPFVILQTANAQLNYSEFPCTDPYVQVQGQPGTTFVGSGDDNTYTINIPFTFNVYLTGYTQFLVGTNGFAVAMPGGAARGFTNGNLPTATAGAALYPHWDDLDSDPAVNPNTGIYWRVDGVAPNRIVSIEWFQIGHFNHDAQGGDITFKIRLFEGSNRIQFQYLDVTFSGTQAGNSGGASATVGVEGPLPAPRPFTLHSFNTNNLVAGQCIEFMLPIPCAPIPGANLVIPASAGLCAANATVTLPTFNPAGCANGVTVGLRYRLNGGAAVNVPLPGTTVVIPNIPLGINTITWETYNIATGALQGSAVQAVTVVDTQPPTITCPANITVNLDPGACSAPVNYIVTASDNCSGGAPITSQLHGTIFTFNNNFATITFGIRNDGTIPIKITGVNANLGD